MNEDDTRAGAAPSGPVSAWLAVLVLLACCLLPYANTWSHVFINYDDQTTIVGLPLIRELSWRTLPLYFVPNLYPQLLEYMPLKNLSYGVDYALFGLSPAGFRVQQQLWYAACVLLLWLWLRSLLRVLAREQRLGLPDVWAERIALLTAALFALHPVHVESVTWLSGRKDVLSGAFMLAALSCGLRYRADAAGRARWLSATWVCCMLALLSKPMAAMLPALLLLQDLICEPTRVQVWLRKRWLLHLGVGLQALAFVALYVTTVPDNSLMDADAAWRLFQGPSWARWGQQLGGFAWLALLPSKLVPIYPPELLDAQPFSPRSLAGLVLLVALPIAGIVAARRRPVLALALGLFALPLLPVLVSPPWAQYVAGRYLFLSVAGPALAFGWCAAWIVSQRAHLQTVVAAACVLFGLFFGFSTLDYNSRWKDSITLWLSSLEVYPSFVTFHDLAARAALADSKLDVAIAVLTDCLRVHPHEVRCEAPLGGILLQIDPPAGERLLRAALPRDISGTAHLRLAQHLSAQGKTVEGAALYEGWLHGKVASMSQIEALAWLDLQAGLHRKALFAARMAVRVGAQNGPAGPPPHELLTALSRLPGDPEGSARLQAALARCKRVDCVKQTLGW